MTEEDQQPARLDGEAESGDEPEEREAEITRLREKLAFYESFDRVIAENVARSGDLLRQAMETRDGASSEIAGAQAESEQERLRDLARQRSLLSALLDDVIQLQGQAERLARRVADALDEVESELPAGEPLATKQAPDDAVESDIVPFAPEPPRDAPSEPAPQERRLTVLAHGIPGPDAARSLREHLSRLDQVIAAEPKEFAEGILRLDVTTRGALTAVDLRGWADGGSFEPVTERGDLIEIRIPAPAASADG